MAAWDDEPGEISPPGGSLERPLSKRGAGVRRLSLDRTSSLPVTGYERQVLDVLPVIQIPEGLERPASSDEVVTPRIKRQHSSYYDRIESMSPREGSVTPRETPRDSMSRFSRMASFREDRPGSSGGGGGGGGDGSSRRSMSSRRASLSAEAMVQTIQDPGPPEQLQSGPRTLRSTSFARRPPMSGNGPDLTPSPPAPSRRASLGGMDARPGMSFDAAVPRGGGGVRDASTQAAPGPWRFFFGQHVTNPDSHNTFGNNPMYNHFDVTVDHPLLNTDVSIVAGDKVPEWAVQEYQRIFCSPSVIKGQRERIGVNGWVAVESTHSKDVTGGGQCVVEGGREEVRMQMTGFIHYVTRLYPRSYQDVEPLMTLQRGLLKYLCDQLDVIGTMPPLEKIQASISAQEEEIARLRREVNTLASRLLDSQKKHAIQIEEVRGEVQVAREAQAEAELEARKGRVRLAAMQFEMDSLKGLLRVRDDERDMWRRKAEANREEVENLMRGRKEDAHLIAKLTEEGRRLAAALDDALEELDKVRDLQEREKQRGLELIRDLERIRAELEAERAKECQACKERSDPPPPPVPEEPEEELVEEVIPEKTGEENFMEDLEKKMMVRAIRGRVEKKLQKLQKKLQELKNYHTPPRAAILVVAAAIAVIDLKKLPTDAYTPDIPDNKVKDVWAALKSEIDMTSADPAYNLFERMKAVRPESDEIEERLKIARVLIADVPYKKAASTAMPIGLLHQWLGVVESMRQMAVKTQQEKVTKMLAQLKDKEAKPKFNFCIIKDELLEREKDPEPEPEPEWSPETKKILETSQSKGKFKRMGAMAKGAGLMRMFA